jgi:hypothetical protein
MSDVISRPRRQNWFVRVLGWPVSMLLIMATVAAGDAIIKHTPGSEEVTRPFVYSGPVGREVDGLSITATVHSVRGAKSIADRDGDVVTTDGVFVVVKLTLTAKVETTNLITARLISNGKTYDSSERMRQPLDPISLQPGVPVQGEMAFELANAAAPGSRLQLSPEDHLLIGGNETVTEINLGIDEATVAKWLAEKSPIELDLAEVQP